MASPSKGKAVQFYHAADLASPTALYIPLRSNGAPAEHGSGPYMLQSHGWVDGLLEAEETPWTWTEDKPETWPRVRTLGGFFFVDRFGKKSKSCAQAVRVAPWQLREPTSVLPLLSLVFVRWAGEHAVGSGSEGNGGWGHWGSPPSDTYMSAIVSHGLMWHQAVGYEGCSQVLGFEVFSLFVGSSHDVRTAEHLATSFKTQLRGVKATVFWMLWPTEWDDAEAWKKYNGGPQITTSCLWKSSGDYAGLVSRPALFSAMRAWEKVGVDTGFPHRADLYEYLASKTWLVDLAMEPEALLPAAVSVERSAVAADAQQAAEDALAALERVRQQQALLRRDMQHIPYAKANAKSVTKGVVKSGFSWEGRAVLSFSGKDQLAICLQQMLGREGCQANICYVQEWVDFDFEMRLFVMPPADWSGPDRERPVLPVHIEWNRWLGFGEEDKPQSACMCSFSSSTEGKCLAAWDNDHVALKCAKERTVQASQFLLGKLLAWGPRPIPMLRLDFLVRRLRPGTVEVCFGEYGEAGSCCLTWEEGPPILWHALLDAALK